MKCVKIYWTLDVSSQSSQLRRQSLNNFEPFVVFAVVAFLFLTNKRSKFVFSYWYRLVRFARIFHKDWDHCLVNHYNSSSVQNLYIMNISRDGHTSSSSSTSGENDLLFIGFNQDSGKCLISNFFIIITPSNNILIKLVDVVLLFRAAVYAQQLIFFIANILILSMCILRLELSIGQ